MAKRPASDMGEVKASAETPGAWFKDTEFHEAQLALVRVHRQGGMQSLMQETAKRLTDLGCVAVPGRDNDKRPIDTWRAIEESARPEDFRTNQMGLLTGPSQLCVVDVDTKDEGVTMWNVLVQTLNLTELIRNDVPYEVTTSGGFHFYFANPASDPLRNSAKLKVCAADGQQRSVGIDVRAAGGYIRCCPSRHTGDVAPFTPFITWVNLPWKESAAGLPSLPLSLEQVLRKSHVLCERKDGTYTVEPVATTKKPRLAPVPAAHLVPPPIAPAGAVSERASVRRLVMEGLSAQRAEEYDDWMRVIWALSFEDHEDGAAGRYLQLCKDFSKRTKKDNLSSDQEIEQRYRKGLAEAPQKQNPVRLATLKAWARTDNPAVLESLRSWTATNAFDRSGYYWSNFVKEAGQKVWNSRDDFKEFCQEHMPRVFALIARAPALYVFKLTADEPYHIASHQFPPGLDFLYAVKEDGDVKRLPLSRFVSEQRAYMHCFSQVDVDPAGVKNPLVVFNLWPGFVARALPAYEEEKVRPFQEIVRLWANGDDSLYWYLLAWFQFLVARPGDKSGTCLVVTGREGAGKSFLCEFLRDFVLGPQVTSFFEGIGDMTEKHNCRKAGRRLWVLDECDSNKDDFHTAMNALKRLITNPVLTENPKGLPSREVRNIGMMLVVSNYSDCISITETDRRYTVVSPSFEKCSDRAWWGEVRTRLSNQDAGDHVYTWLLSLRDLPDPTRVYENEARKRVQEISQPAYAIFIAERLKMIREDNWWIGADQLYQEFCFWCRANKYKDLKSRNFHHKLLELIQQDRVPMTERRYKNRRGYGPKNPQIHMGELTVELPKALQMLEEPTERNANGEH